MSDSDSDYGSITLQVRHATGKGAARTLRRAGLAPAVVYGCGQDNVSVSFSPHELRKATDPSLQGNTLFSVTLSEEGKDDVTTPCMMTEIQRHPLKSEFLHVDFMRVDVDKPITRTVPVSYEGRAAGVAAGGRLRTFLKSMRVSAKPADIPTAVVIDLTPLNAGDTFRVSDLQIPNVTAVATASQPLALVELPKAERAESEDDAKADDKADDKAEDKK